MKKVEQCPKTIIPNDVIFHSILARLPVKSLTRFKSVSKSWNSVISTPEFTKSHLHYSSLLSPLFFIASPHSMYTLAYTHNNTLTQLVNLDTPFPPNTQKSPHCGVKIIGCCNGLVCLSIFENRPDEFYSYFIVWNPATCQRRVISAPFKYQSTSECIPVECIHGFGYQLGSTDDYKIVVSLSKESCLWVFSLRFGQWKSIDFPSDHPFLHSQNKIRSICTHIDGILYWYGVEHRMFCLCTFSLVDEQFTHHTISSIPEKVIYVTELCVFKGCLSRVSRMSDQFEVFVMKRQGDFTEWEKLFTIPRLPFNFSLYFSITGKCLVHQTHIDENGLRHSNCNTQCLMYKQCQSKLKLIDSTLEDLEHSQGIDFEDMQVQSVHQHVESLVSPHLL